MAIAIAGLGLGAAISPTGGDRNGIMLTLLLFVLVPFWIEAVLSPVLLLPARCCKRDEMHPPSGQRPGNP